MHPDHTNATIEDLWPGDFIVARAPGSYYGSAHRFVDAENDRGHLYLKLADPEGGYEFMVYAPLGWETRVEKV